jgi:phosphatidylserine/phosphatidylglycerophosphate/cardiolipin synthase-like enzyme
VVVDDHYTLIGSANFTHNAHARNIEVGLLLIEGTTWRSTFSASSWPWQPSG